MRGDLRFILTSFPSKREEANITTGELAIRALGERIRATRALSPFSPHPRADPGRYRRSPAAPPSR
jgi:hypothetical protein